MMYGCQQSIDMRLRNTGYDKIVREVSGCGDKVSYQKIFVKDQLRVDVTLLKSSDSYRVDKTVIKKKSDGMYIKSDTMRIVHEEELLGKISDIETDIVAQFSLTNGSL